MNPPRTSSWWLAASASAGASRSVGMKSLDQRMVGNDTGATGEARALSAGVHRDLTCCRSLTEHQRGLLIGAAGVAAIIPDATLVRMIDAPSLTAAAWRTGLTASAIFAFLLWRYRGGVVDAVRGLGRWGTLISVLSGSGTILFVVAVDNTAVANVVIILALTPMWSAIVTRIFLGETIERRTQWAIPAAFVGVAIAVAGSLDAGLRSGDVAALAASILLALNFTIIRINGEIDMVPAVGVGNALGCIALVATGASLSLEPGDLTPMLFLGLLFIPLALALINTGARYLSSPEMSLLLLGETAISPIMAAVVVDEPITGAAIIGGVVVIATLAVHALAGLRSADPAVAS